MKQFEIPEFYRSSVISRLKNHRKGLDPRKKDFSPAILDCGPVRFYVPRHFGFCYGVENAVEISFRTIQENPDKRIFLLSQMIHNPAVNADLESMGLRFIMDTEGKQFIPWSEISSDDVVITPAFGTTLEIEQMLIEKGIELQKYDTTCPFVQKVWNRSAKLGEDGYTIIIHGKHQHEETRATFSHSDQHSPSVIVLNIDEARLLGQYVLGEKDLSNFEKDFGHLCSTGFDPKVHLDRVGVVNQTTMLATETQEIADYFKQVMAKKHGSEDRQFFADTRDTLCYATNDNQQATIGALQEETDMAVVVGGYNSSNTSHIVELCEEKVPTFFIRNADEIESQDVINHFDIHQHREVKSNAFMPQKEVVRVILTSGASCPDAVVESVMKKILSFFPNSVDPEEAMAGLEQLA